jgi:predicted phosphoribosyltransferase
MPVPAKTTEYREFRDHIGVFADRHDAGQVLASMLEDYRGTDAVVVALPAGGVPVALPIADQLELPLEVTPVSKITLPWNTEVGYGAVAYDGTVRLNQALLPHFGLSDSEIEQGIERTHAKVRRRMRALRGSDAAPELAGRTVIVVDDGLASGFTMRVALEALAKLSPEELVVAVPTAHQDSIARIADDCDRVVCANIRGGRQFAVARAYREWHDVSEDELVQLLRPRTV